MQPSDYCVEVDGWFYIPYSNFQNPATMQKMKRFLTVQSRFKYDQEGQLTEPIYLYNDRPEDSCIGVPLRWGLKTFGHITSKIITDKLVCPAVTFSKLPDLYHEKASKDQPLCVEATVSALKNNFASLLVAPTGSGKTVMACSIIGHLQTKALVILHNERLLEQWRYELMDKLGLSEQEIGTVKASLCDYEDKKVVLGSLQTLYKGKYNTSLKNQFGLIVIDEVHKIGAPKLSGVLGLFSSRYQLALTATPTRKDGREDVFLTYFGTGDATAKAAALPIKVNILPYVAKTRNWGKDRNGKILCISRDSKRNKLIASLVVRLYKDGRNILVVSEYKAQLACLFSLLSQLGIPEEDLGKFYNGAIPTTKKAEVQKHFDNVISRCPIILATYGMIKEGISINRLDAGIDATPRTDATQLIGRIRRPYENKKLPLWYTINDVSDRLLSNFTEARVKDYQNDPSVELVRHDSSYRQ